MFNQKRRNRFGGFPLFRASGYRSQCGLKRPSPPLSAQYSRAMRQHGLFALLAIGGAFSFQTSSNQIMRLLSVMARQRTNEGLRLRRTITKPEPEKPMIWRIAPGILMPITPLRALFQGNPFDVYPNKIGNRKPIDIGNKKR